MTDFNYYSDDYKKLVEESISFINQKPDFFIKAKAEHIHDITFKHFSHNNVSLLDVGCGPGITDTFLKSHYENLTGIDISSGCIEQAKKNNPRFNYVTYDGDNFPFSDETFEVVFAVCVFHHVKPQNWPRLLSEMKRVTKKGGLTLIFEHNPLNPLTRKAVRDCTFDADAILLPMSTVKGLFRQVGFKTLFSKYILFFPFSNSFTRWIEARLAKLFLGAQFYVGGERAIEEP